MRPLESPTSPLSMSSARTAMPRVSTLAAAVVIALAAPIALGQQSPAAGGAAQPAAPARAMGSRRSSCSAAASSSSARPRPRAKAPSAAPICSCGRCCASPSCSKRCPAWSPCSTPGSGKANQYFLRGFNLDHGTDFTTILDGVPLNLRSHGHGQGYLDVNGMMPETVERIDYRKGTYRADVGDFSMAGAAFITTIERLDAPFLALEGGENGWGRLAGGRHQGARTTARASRASIEHKTYDGPWEQPEDLEHTSLWGKYRRPTDFGTLGDHAVGLRRTLAAHGADSRARDRHERLRGRVLRARPDCAGRHEALDLRCADGRRRVERLRLRAVLRLVHVVEPDLRRPDQPVRQTLDDGRPLRAHAARNRLGRRSSVGAEFRYDDISNVGLDEFDAGEFVANIGQNSIQETSLGAFTEVSWSRDRPLCA